MILQRTFHLTLGSAPDQALNLLRSMLEDTRVTTLQHIARISSEQLHWQYQPGWNTVGALLAHLTALEHYFRIVYVEGRALTDAENQHWLPALDLGVHVPQLITGQDLASYQAGLAESRHQLLAALEGVSEEQLTRRIEDYDPVHGCNLAWVLFHLAEDEIYHRGQISLLLKLQRAHNETGTLPLTPQSKL
ncbi:DinB family protein [Hymenobacter oligotrophus]|nr:DinB family protein [Hymenobacter oligotrophus]